MVVEFNCKPFSEKRYKMKKKIFAAFMALAISLSAFSSCAGLTGSTGGGNTNAGSTINNGNVTVEGGPNYENINIQSSANKNLLAASKALLSSVSIVCKFTESSWGSSNQTASAGSGVIYKLDKEKGDAYIITNYHVV